MLNWLIDFSLRHRAVVILAALFAAVLGGISLRQLDIDAFPDTTPVQVQINTVAPSLSPEEVERQITFPVEQAISGLPDLEELRSLSKFGLSQVLVTFADGVDIYFARQLINERLNTVELPSGIERPQMGPVSTGLGEVFHYVLTYEGVDFSQIPAEERISRLTELRTIHDWVVKPQLRSVPGVAEVNSWGGYEKQYQVRLEPDLLIKHGLTFVEFFVAHCCFLLSMSAYQVAIGNTHLPSEQNGTPTKHATILSSKMLLAGRFSSVAMPSSDWLNEPLRNRPPYEFLPARRVPAVSA